MTKITLFPKGSGRKEFELETLQIPDLWHLAMDLDDKGHQRMSKMVLETWHLAHELKRLLIEATREE